MFHDSWLNDPTIRVGALALVAVLGFAPRQTSPQQPVFHAGTDVVELDVSVFDKDRHPVKGLKAEDFTILQDGTPQPVVAFAPIDLPDPIPMTATWMRDAPVDVDTNEVTDRRLVVILIDDALVGYEKYVDMGKLKLTRDAANRVVDGLGPEDVAAVVFTGDDYKGQNLTADHARLKQAIGRLTVGPPPPPEDRPVLPSGPYHDCSQYWNSVDTLKNVVDALAGVPHRRKLLVDVSVGVNIDIFGHRDEDNPCTGKARAETTMALETAEENNVTIYGVDPTGLRTSFGRSVDNASVNNRQLMYLDNLSSNTGGRAIINTNGIANAMPGILAENGSYYLLGYSAPENAKTRESLKRVEVKVNRAGVEVRSRSLYAAPASGSQAVAPPVSESSIAEIVPKADLPLRVSAVPIRAEDGASAVALVVGVRQPASVQAASDQVDLVVNAFTVDGRNRTSAKQSTHVSVRAMDAVSTTGGDARSEVLARVPLPPGRYSLRIAAHSAAAGVDGSVDTDVIVPDFKKDAISLSGIVMSASPGPRAAPADALAGLVPISPTAERTFDRANQVSAFVRVYQGGSSAPAPVSMHIRVLGDRDVASMERTEILPSEAFATARSADETVKLRVADWPPGPYLLRIDATAGKHTATRDVRFDVR